MTYRRKFDNVQAVQWFKDGDHPRVITDSPPGGACPRCSRPFSVHGWLDLGRENVCPLVCPGDYIVTDAKGNVRVVKPDMFEAEWEAVK